MSAMKTKEIESNRDYCLGETVIDVLSREVANEQRSAFLRLVTCAHFSSLVYFKSIIFWFIFLKLFVLKFSSQDQAYCSVLSY